MTKTLTEQWREGTLPYTYYYVKHTFGWKPFGINIDFWHGPFDKWGYLPEQYIKEVLAPVPSYDEYNKLRKLPLKCFQLEEDNSALMVINKDMCKEKERIEKKLAIATKALKDIRGWDEYDCMGLAKKALKEMEGVK